MEKIHDIRFGDNLYEYLYSLWVLYMTSKVQTKYKLDYLKITFVFNQMIKSTEWRTIYGENTNKLYISDKGLISKIYKGFMELKDNKNKISIKTWRKNLNRHVSKEDTQMAKNHISLTSLITQIKSTTRYHFIPISIVTIYIYIYIYIYIFFFFLMLANMWRKWNPLHWDVTCYSPKVLMKMME